MQDLKLSEFMVKILVLKIYDTKVWKMVKIKVRQNSPVVRISSAGRILVIDLFVLHNLGQKIDEHFSKDVKELSDT